MHQRRTVNGFQVSELNPALTADLLQRRRAQLDGDVGEEAVPLRAEVSDDIRVRVGLPEKLHLPLRYLKTLGQNSLDGYATPIEFAPEVQENDDEHVTNVTTKTTLFRFNDLSAKDV